MKKNFTLIGVFVLVAALYAWGSRPVDSVKSAPRWEFKLINRTTMVVDLTKMPQDDTSDPVELKKALEPILEQEKTAKKAFETNLKTAGAQGWELVAVTSELESTLGGGIGAKTLTAFLKRKAN